MIQKEKDRKIIRYLIINYVTKDNSNGTFENPHSLLHSAVYRTGTASEPVCQRYTVLVALRRKGILFK